MPRIIGSPLRYIQGPGEMKNLYKHLKNWGNNFIVIIDKPILSIVEKDVKTSFKACKGKAVYALFENECTMKQINALAKKAQSSKCDVLVSIGGGKCADACKAAAFKAHTACVIVSTAASCDAPCSHSAIIYKENHEFDQYYYPIKSPDVVIVDSEIIARAPVRLLRCGLADALSTYFEARSCWRTGRDDVTEWKAAPSVTAYALAKLCYDTILKQGYKACVACENKVVTQALEDVIEANTYLSTIGFESGGLGAAHSIQDALGLIPEIHSMYHGEKVAFGTLVHLVLENADVEELNKVLQFLFSLNLPMCLEDLNVKYLSPQMLTKVAKKATGEGVPMKNMPFKVTPEMVEAAIIVADKLGKYFKKHGKVPGGLNDLGNDCRCDLKKDNKCGC